jgi:hypothetical protein
LGPGGGLTDPDHSSGESALPSIARPVNDEDND